MVVSGVEGFDELVAARYDGLRRAAFVLVGDRQHAEDVVQTTLMGLHRSWHRVAGVEDLDGYLHVALVNASRSWWRRRWHGERPTADLPDGGGSDLAAGVDLRDALVRAVATLPAAQREVLVLRHIGGLSEAETAAALRCSVGTVKSRTSRALTTLRTSGLLDDVRAT